MITVVLSNLCCYPLCYRSWFEHKNPFSSISLDSSSTWGIAVSSMDRAVRLRSGERKSLSRMPETSIGLTTPTLTCNLIKLISVI